eukprot:gnl/TRDRNA2_/TRDRNA2_180379_c0_seq1.p1 gnl/TRDRNA2_/TRDRNA2_180379_c0~~gnl/TRDRNA2_/TRDRNA2_180379_c0_seq1.p1  ORF type:complete len:153 (+),score=39.50 gnl/TRDRNA2_/TRDRNA2_180379_c0_seq1:61-459(+)
MSCIRLLALLLVGAAAISPSTWSAPEANPAAVQKRNQDLRNSMRQMMNDDDDDDDLSDDSSGQKVGLMQQGTDESMDAYMESSANALNNVLGDRWNGQKLEADAKEKTKAFLNGLRGGNSMNSINAMMGALR